MFRARLRRRLWNMGKATRASTAPSAATSRPGPPWRACLPRPSNSLRRRRSRKLCLSILRISVSTLLVEGQVKPVPSSRRTLVSEPSVVPPLLGMSRKTELHAFLPPYTYPFPVFSKHPSILSPRCLYQPCLNILLLSPRHPRSRPKASNLAGRLWHGANEEAALASSGPAIVECICVFATALTRGLL